ncbi:MAG: ATP-binding cassette subfamily B multidrug efflux pump [Salibacteraceae bacterium]|jgi:ATP-binding cassette subfamily B protein
MAKSVSGNVFDLKLLKRVLSYVKPYQSTFNGTAILVLLLAIIAPIRPFLVQYAVDNYILQPNEAMLYNVTILLVALLIVEAGLQFFQTYLANWLGQSVVKDIRVSIYTKINNFKLQYFDKTPIGTLVTRVVSDMETISDIFSQGILIIIGDLLKLIAVIGFMFWQDWRLTLIVLLPMPILFIATNWFKNYIKHAFQDVRTSISNLNTFVQEHLTGMNIVQIFNREDRELEAFRQINEKHKQANIRTVWANSVFFPIVEVLSAISLALLVWWGAGDVISGTTTLGTLMAFIMYINMLYRPIRQLADKFNTLQMGMVASERIFKVLDTDASISDTGELTANNLQGVLEFKNLWFAYTDENWILKGVSFKVNSGQTVAFVGATGAGKTSIINLLGRFYEFQKGEILLDENNIRAYQLSELRENLGVVLQDVFLFSDTILNNISLRNPQIKESQIIEASKIVGAHDFISKLPGGYNFNVQERGGMLSSGQRQLIAFIRAYVYNPKILILDEATSSVDSETERLIQNAIDILTKGRTSIIIAHRLATVQKADNIIVIDQGEIVEQGSHDELLTINGFYHNLFELQFSKG